MQGAVACSDCTALRGGEGGRPSVTHGVGEGCGTVSVGGVGPGFRAERYNSSLCIVMCVEPLNSMWLVMGPDNPRVMMAKVLTGRVLTGT